MFKNLSKILFVSAVLICSSTKIKYRKYIFPHFHGFRSSEFNWIERDYSEIADKFDTYKNLTYKNSHSIDDIELRNENDGRRAALNINKFMISIHENDILICSGSIIDRKHILTAASCLWGKDANTLLVRIKDFQKEGDLWGVYIRKIILHKKFEPTRRSFDIAILQISGYLPGSDRSIKLCSAPKRVRWLPIYYISFTTSDYVDYSLYLKKIGGVLVQKEECQNKFLPKVPLDVSMVCATPRTHYRGMCPRDEGGAIVIYNTKLNEFMQIGILSIPFVCQNNFSLADVFTDLGSVYKFIEMYTSVHVKMYEQDDYYDNIELI